MVAAYNGEPVNYLRPIFLGAVPDASPDEIDAAVERINDDILRRAERKHNATSGNEGKRATPGDGTIPFKRP